MPSFTCRQKPFTSFDGQVFSLSVWEAPAAPRGIIVAIHGLSGAAIDFEPLGRRLAPLGFTTYAPELRGQGNDPLPSRRGDLTSINVWFSDLSTFLAKIRAQHAGLPVFYYGESMGAAILTRFLGQADPIDRPVGLVLASPVVALQQTAPFWLMLLFRLLLLVWPSFRIDLRPLARRDKAPRIVTRDEAHREWYATAPHKLDVFTVRFFKCLQELIAGCFEVAPRLHLPVLIVYAHNDVFIRPELVEQFFVRLGSMDKEITLYPESYHLLLHDHDREAVLERVSTWLTSRVKC